jgi:hypothetical protein
MPKITEDFCEREAEWLGPVAASAVFQELLKRTELEGDLPQGPNMLVQMS